VPSLLQADRLYRFYRAGDEETLALQGVTLHLRANEMLAVVGPSGSGKSTLLACLAGLDEPSGGSVWIGQERLSHRPEAVRARMRAHHVGVLTQGNNLFGHLSVLGNIRLAQRLSGDPPIGAEDLLQSVGMRERRDAYPPELSGGEEARASIAVALANDPAVLIADEPTGELDEATEHRVLCLLRRVALS
jgi:putative ABC transport system ATP-binding protein